MEIFLDFLDFVTDEFLITCGRPRGRVSGGTSQYLNLQRAQFLGSFRFGIQRQPQRWHSTGGKNSRRAFFFMRPMVVDFRLTFQNLPFKILFVREWWLNGKGNLMRSVFFVLLLSTPAAAGLVSVDFHELNWEGNNNLIDTPGETLWTNGSIVFSPLPGISGNLAPSLEWAKYGSANFNGSPALSLTAPLGGIGLTRSTGDTFSLLSIDVGAWDQEASADPFTFQLFGVRADGSVVTETQTIVLNDFTHPAHLYFSNLTNLVSVNWLQGSGFGGGGSAPAMQWDNLLLDTTPVPEIGTLALLGIALVLINKRKR